MIPQTHAAIVAGVVGVVALALGRAFGIWSERDRWLEAHRNGKLSSHAIAMAAYVHDRFHSL